MTSSRRSRPLIAFGVVLIVVGLAAAVVLWGVGDNRRSDAVAGFARAPVGCDTTLDFAATGEYLVYVETAGRLDAVRGDCDVSGEYDVRPERPEPVITVVDPDGEAVTLASVAADLDLDYDDSGFVGTAVFSIDIAEASDYVMRVESSDDAMFVVAVGPDPTDGVVALQVGAVAAGFAGLMVGIGAILFGARRSHQASAAPAWAPTAPVQPGTFAPGQPPQGPPVHGQPQGPPQYGYAVPGRQPPPPNTAPSGPPAGAGFMPPPPPRPQSSPSPVPQPGPPRIPGQPSLGPTAPQPSPAYSPPPGHDHPADDVPHRDDPGDDETTSERWPPVPPPE